LKAERFKTPASCSLELPGSTKNVPPSEAFAGCSQVLDAIRGLAPCGLRPRWEIRCIPRGGNRRRYYDLAPMLLERRDQVSVRRDRRHRFLQVERVSCFCRGSYPLHLVLDRISSALLIPTADFTIGNLLGLVDVMLVQDDGSRPGPRDQGRATSVHMFAPARLHGRRRARSARQEQDLRLVPRGPLEINHEPHLPPGNKRS